ncbi:MAG: helix-turn-helix domain-containing protein [Pseudomonadota bacterium]
MSARPLSTGLKCLEMLEVVAAQPGAGRLADLARAVGESRATTHQRLLTLVTAGWVERTEDGHYRLSLRPCRIARAALDQAGLGDRVLPSLQALTNQTGCASSLVVLEGTRIVIAQRVEAGGVLRADLRVGAAMPWDVSASGAIWLAHGPADLRARLEEAGTTLPDSSRIEEARRDHVAYGLSEGMLAGIGGVAAPVTDASGALIASLSAVWVTGQQEAGAVAHAVRSAASDLASALQT